MASKASRARRLGGHAGRVVLVGLTSVAAGSVHAQSSVTLYGVMDVGLNFRTAAGSGSDGKSASALQLASGNELTSRWGLLGNEDLGDGLALTFKLESGFNAATGSGNFSVPFPADTGALFDRSAVVGITSTRWGKVLLGRNWSPFFDGISAGDATGYLNFGSLANATFQNSSNLNPALGLSGAASGQYSAANGGLMYTWVNNSVKYMLPDNTYGLTGGLLYSFGGTAGSLSNKSAMSANLNWTNGTLGFASGFFSARDPSGLTNNIWLRALTIGATYVLGPVKLGFNFAKFQNPTTGANQNYYYTGAAWQATPTWRFTADWLHLQDLKNSAAGADLYKAGVAYLMSKRSTLYFDVAFSGNKAQGMLGAGSNTSLLTSPATVGHNQLAIGTGLRTLF
jgi:predicted porin